MLKRLDVQILLILSLILAAMISVFGWRVGSRQGEIYVATVTESARVLARTHASSAAHFLVINDYAGLEVHMLEAAQLPDILNLQVVEPDGTILCQVERPVAGGKPSISYRQKKVAVPSGNVSFINLEAEQLISWTPIQAGKPLGWLKLSYSLQPVQQMQQSVWRTTLLMGGFWILVGIALMVLVLRRPLWTIRDLAAFAHDLNLRKGEQIVVPRVANEIDQLASALNYASTELLSAEQQLIAEQERLAVTIRSIGDGVLACDRDGRVTLMNRVAEELTGWTAAEAIGRTFAEVFTVIDDLAGKPIATPLQLVIESGRVIELMEHAVLVARDGTRRNIADSGAPIINVRGETVGVVVVFRDDTVRLQNEQKRVQLEEQLRQAQKMEAIGHLAGGIAHDFNNILTAIIGYTEIIIDSLDQASRPRELAQRVRNAAARAASLTAGLLAFSRKQKIELKPCDLNVIVLDQQKMLQRIIGEDVRLQTVLTSVPLPINADAGQIAQVIMNMATNARDAMGAGGLLSISTQMIELDDVSREHEGPLPDTGRFALLCISDSGIGMNDNTMARIFEPFFTTKMVGKGTGLGLAIVHGIVQQHGGFIRVYSNAGIGTTFKIYLPLLEGAVIVDEVSESQPVRGGSERILLVEDEAEVRQVLRMMLEGGGYLVSEAGNGVEALELLAQEQETIHLVISDVIMPQMTGKELHNRMAELYPWRKMLFISGYTADVIQHKGILEQDVDLLMKPFSANTLLARVREVLDR